MNAATYGNGTQADPWILKTPPLTSDFQAWRDEAAATPALIVQVGSTRLSYHLRCLEDLPAMLRARRLGRTRKRRRRQTRQGRVRGGLGPCPRQSCRRLLRSTERLSRPFRQLRHAGLGIARVGGAGTWAAQQPGPKQIARGIVMPPGATDLATTPTTPGPGNPLPPRSPRRRAARLPATMSACPP